MCDCCHDYDDDSYYDEYREARKALEATWDYKVRGFVREWKFRLRHPLSYKKRRAVSLKAFDKVLREDYLPMIREQLNAEHSILKKLEGK